MDSFYVMDDCKVYRRRDGGEQYWCRIYSDTDKKYIRRSLKTKNKELAIINCKNFYKEVIKLSSTGETIITTSVSSLIKYMQICLTRAVLLSLFLPTISDSSRLK